jgi:hypothetical protein
LFAATVETRLFCLFHAALLHAVARRVLALQRNRLKGCGGDQRNGLRRKLKLTGGRAGPLLPTGQPRGHSHR